MDKDYSAIALQYAEDVVGGEIPNCKWAIAACQRHLDDLEKDWNYTYSPERAEKVCKFVENLPHIKGQWVGQDMVLQPWQAFVLCVVFGWLDEYDNRRFRTAYLEVPRKNGKSFLMSGVALYMLCNDNEPGAECFSVAVKKEQSRLVWETARRQVLKTPELAEAFGVEAWKHSIFVDSTASSFVPLASDSNSLDGLSVHFGGIDELHAHKSREVFDVMETGTGSREQSLLLVITTAGSNRAGVCFEQRDYVTKLLTSVVKDESYFGTIYTLDDDDIEQIWNDPKLLIKANPNYGVSVLPFDIERLWRKAKQTPSAVNNFLTKRANVWTNADTSWMDMWKWDACADPTLSIDDFKGERCWMGGDFASKRDIAALCLLFERNGHLYPFLRYYLPEEVCRNTPNDMLAGWWREGRITATPGQIIDFDYIEQDCEKLSSLHEITEFGYDPFQATQFAGRMIAKGWSMVEVRQTAMQLSEPMKQLEGMAIAGTIHHNDPVLTWMVSNVTCQEDYNRNIFPRKAGSSAKNKGGDPNKKIDGVSALLNAMNRYMEPDEAPSIYNTRGLTLV